MIAWLMPEIIIAPREYYRIGTRLSAFTVSATAITAIFGLRLSRI